MTNSNIEKMKKIIEEKKKISAQQGYTGEKANKKIGNYQKAFKNNKGGGVFDK